MAFDPHNKGGNKRKLTEEELQWVSDTMAGASQDHKPSIRWFAHQLGVTRPTLIKALGGWKGIQRKAPQKVKPLFGRPDINASEKPVTIEPHTTESPIGGGNLG